MSCEAVRGKVLEDKLWSAESGKRPMAEWKGREYNGQSSLQAGLADGPARLEGVGPQRAEVQSELS
jgi:hypothetical protein